MKASRALQIFRANGWISCRYCHRLCGIAGHAPAERALSVDHWLPVCRGGSSDLSNLVPCCQRCNNAKGPLTGEEYLAVMHDATQARRKALITAALAGVTAAREELPRAA